MFFQKNRRPASLMVYNIIKCAGLCLLLVVALLFPLKTSAQSNSVYYCRHTCIPPEIDGKTDDLAWEKTSFSEPFVDIEGASKPLPIKETKIAMLWDDTCLYISAILTEDHIAASLRQRDTVVFWDNDFEVFIDPDGDAAEYTEIEVNAFGTLWDLMLDKPYIYGGIAYSEYNIDGLRWAISCNGTINNPNDIDSSWQVEMAIPFRSIISRNSKTCQPTTGSVFRINFSRVQWDYDVVDGNYFVKRDSISGNRLPENNYVWAPQGTINMHKPWKWGYLVFTDSLGNPSKYKDEASLQKKYLRKLLNRIISYRSCSESSMRILESGISDDWRLLFAEEPKISIHKRTVQISAIDINQKQIWKINQDGRIWSDTLIRAWVWMHARPDYSDAQYDSAFALMQHSGISGVLFCDEGDELMRILPIAKNNNIEVQAWIWTLNCNNDTVLQQHPEWYNINRLNQRSNDNPQYVAYYKWLCPNNPEVIDYLKQRVNKLSSTIGLNGIHLDYIRFPDVILPIALWPTYGIIQDREYPAYDYCYCPICKKKFFETSGIDIDSVPNPSNLEAWIRFRYKSITNLVAVLDSVSNRHEMPLTAAVFPSPAIARSLVRQDWPSWSIDGVFPMTYASFYLEDIQWIGDCVRNGKSELSQTTTLSPGLYMPDMSPEKFVQALNIILDSGADGVALFDFSAMQTAHWTILRQWVGQNRK